MGRADSRIVQKQYFERMLLTSVAILRAQKRKAVANRSNVPFAQ